jgi:molybdopterin-binding protein
MLFELKNLKKSFGKKKIIDIDSLSIDSGCVVGIAGPNGSGKTTFLEMLSGLQKPSSGNIIFNGEQICNVENDRVVMVLQNPVMFNMSVYENVAFGLRATKVDADRIKRKVNRELEFFGLSSMHDRNAKDLSGGERQKVAIARAVVLNPEVLILDEPTAGLDFQARSTLQSLILKLYSLNPRRTIVVASHDKDFLHSISQKTYVIVNRKPLIESFENFYKVDVLDNETVKINDSIPIKVVAEKTGSAYIIISPDSIVLSEQSLDTSMRNSIKGEVVKVSHDNKRDVLIWLDVGFEICCKITKASYEKMKIHLGEELWVSFKATSVKVF